MTDRMTIRGLHDRIGITPDTPGYGEAFGVRSKAALFATLSNPAPAPLLPADIDRVAADLGVSPAIIRAVRKVEAPRGAFDSMGRPSILFERHKFRSNCEPIGRFDKAAPDLSGKPYGAGGYGTYEGQYEKLAAACKLDPHAAFAACSWGAFQVLGEHYESLGYSSPWMMALALREGEAAHLDSFVRFVRGEGLVDELRACKPGNAHSCIPFVSRYNGSGFRQFNYHIKLAQAAL